MSTTSTINRLLSAPRTGVAGVVLAALMFTGAAADGSRANTAAPAKTAAQVTRTAQQVAKSAVAAVPAVLESANVPPALARQAQPDVLQETMARLSATAPELDEQVLRLALQARENARARGLGKKSDLLTVIDYSLPSTAKRMWVFDVATGRVLFHELVAHGKNTGDNFARSFSNRENSLQTSLGLFVTAGTYVGGNGYSLKLQGLEETNDQAMARAIVMHGAPYVSEAFAKAQGRIGRSWGCPALSQKVAKTVIDTIKGGSLVFSYYPESNWLQKSPFLRGADSVVQAAAAR